MSLDQKKCVPCEGGVEKLRPEEAVRLRKEHTPQWEIVGNPSKIAREFRFGNFKQALAFVNKVGEIAESEGHHPDIAFGWGYAKIELYTHAIGGLHENDFIMAAKIDRIGL